MKFTDHALALLKRLEGCRLTAYRDQASAPQILDSGRQGCQRIAKKTEAGVAAVAEDAAHETGAVVVVGVPSSSSAGLTCATQCASLALRLEQDRPRLNGHSVREPEPQRSSTDRIASLPRGFEFLRVRLAPSFVRRDDFVFIRSVVPLASCAVGGESAVEILSAPLLGGNDASASALFCGHGHAAFYSTPNDRAPRSSP